MKIACITVFCNELFRLDNWKRYYSEYKDDIALHVIVNNGNLQDSFLLKSSFPESIVLDSPGGNLLKAYNLGTEYVLNDKDVDAIMQITNDVKFKPGSIQLLYNELFSDTRLAVVGPILLAKDSDIVEVFGIDVSRNNLVAGNQRFPFKGKRYSQVSVERRKVAYVSAGVIMQKRSVIEKMGYQDEKIMMYCDERDVAIRLNRLGYYEAVIKDAIAWHQHVNKVGKVGRSLLAPFYSSRNSIYLILKHSNIIIAICKSFEVIVYNVVLIVYHLFKGQRNSIRYDFTVIMGALYGLFGKMDTYPKWLLSK